jgi:hypothetical protein
MSTQLEKDLFMLQWILNGFLKVGSDLVRRSDVRTFVDPESDEVFEALSDWESRKFIAIIKDPRQAKEKDICFRILRPIEAIAEPEDLNAEER